MEKLSNEEIISIMNKPKSIDLLNFYMQIWQQATGYKFIPSNCCGRFNKLYTLCLNKSRELKNLKL